MDLELISKLPSTEPNDAKSRILASATELFADRGFAATSVRDVATKAGLVPGAIYNHFASKQEILAEIALSDTGRLRNSVRKATKESQDTVTRLRLIVTALAEHAVVRRAPLRIGTREISLLPAEAAVQLAKMQRQVIDSLTDALSVAVQEGLIPWIPTERKSLRATARFITHGLIQAGNSFNHDPGWNLQAVIDLHIELVMSMLLKPAQTQWFTNAPTGGG